MYIDTSREGMALAAALGEVKRLQIEVEKLEAAIMTLRELRQYDRLEIERLRKVNADLTVTLFESNRTLRDLEERNRRLEDISCQQQNELARRK